MGPIEEGDATFQFLLDGRRGSKKGFVEDRKTGVIATRVHCMSMMILTIARQERRRQAGGGSGSLGWEENARPWEHCNLLYDTTYGSSDDALLWNLLRCQLAQ